MHNKYLITSLTVIFLLYGIVFTVNNFANAITGSTPQITPDATTLEKAEADFMANICSSHGGINCSILNSDASIECNDGTIDSSLSTIYAIPQCQKTIEALVTQQSDFMAESGCFPPSEIACFSEQSYQNLYKVLNASGLANSELGKSELAQCRKDITAYEIDNKNYKQCLVNYNQPNFTPSGKIALPILKAVFCPLFYGNKSSYNQANDLCLCDTGYFLHNGQCTQANKICQQKYGSQAVAKNGNCTISNSTLITPKPTKLPLPTQVKTPDTSEIILSTPNQDISYQTQESTPTEPTSPSPNLNELSANNRGLVRKVIDSIISGIKNMLKLF